MPAMRSARTVRSLTFFNTLLMASAFTVPAFAQIETVVVTAERKAEDIQTVPVSVTALTGTDLKAKQVYNFRDLQFHVPSVTYTKHQFGGAQFSIRGVTSQFGLGPAIAQNLDDVYLEAPGLVSSEYYDIDRVEVSRGPQSTSFGRAATGGAVNVITAKPDLDNFSARASFDYGSFNTFKPDGEVNVPLIPGELGLRVAVHADFHDGYEKNIYSGPAIYPTGLPGNRVNGLGDVQGRVSLRWQPSDNTTIDLVADGGYESDNRVRGDAQLCHRDPAGILGCLPDQLGSDRPNLNAWFANDLASKQGITLAAETLGTPVGLSVLAGAVFGMTSLGGNGCTAISCPNAAGLGSGDPAGAAGTAFNNFGFDTPADVNGVGSNPGTVPSSVRNPLIVDTAFKPTYRGQGATYLMNWSQTITDWLKSTLDLGYTDGYQRTQQAAFFAPGEDVSSNVTAAVAAFDALVPTHAAYDAAYFNVPGALPISSVTYGGRFGSYGGIIDNTRGGILTKSKFTTSYDEDWFSDTELTGELRFQTSFKGPLNFSSGFFLMNYRAANQYWYAGSPQDWAAIVLGGIQDIVPTSPCFGTHCVFADPEFDAEYRKGDVQSRSAFLEATYDIVPDELKAVVGGRFNDDRSHEFTTPIAIGAGVLTNGTAQIGATNVTLPFTFPVPRGLNGKNNVTNDLWTGRAVIDWTPKLDWTEQTLVYLSASRGELNGGINNSNIAGVSIGVPVVFKPATVDALELGTKNTLLDGTLQANLTAWYYNYENYQVGIIAARQALTINIPARLYGLEGEALWQPTEELGFNFSLSLTQSHAGHAFLPDQRNPTANNPNTILVKDLVTGSNCTLIRTTAAANTSPGDSAAYHVQNFYLPNGGNSHIDAISGVPTVNYGYCSGSTPYPFAVAGFGTGTGNHTSPDYRDALLASGFDYAPNINPATGAVIPIAACGSAANPDPNSGTASATAVHCQEPAGTGIPVDLHGNRLPEVPFAQVGIGGQYMFKLDGGYSIVPRIDYYWQASTFARVWNDSADRIGAWSTMNLQVQVNAPDSLWYARAFATNVFDNKNITGQYLQDPAAALFTNVFAEDPRVLGISVGTSW